MGEFSMLTKTIKGNKNSFIHNGKLEKMIWQITFLMMQIQKKT